MINTIQTYRETAGLLREGLVFLALLNTALVLGYNLLNGGTGEGFLHIFLTFIAPVLAPLFVVGIFFDYLMTRIKAADAREGGQDPAPFRAVCRVDLWVLALQFLYWVPFFATL